ncbi:HAD-IA family hydrolase [Bosea sp. 117]|uniref:HAD-IA family hydrolase n=1 Tax=Bosea sp. 117 TaxID=1125973 RepID=UPI000AC5654F|nr:HAD-IA family hydrolase [Bosea sp. 117]
MNGESPNTAAGRRPRLVIFDMDDVLVRYLTEERRAAMGAPAGLTAEQVAERVWDSGIEDAGDIGALTPEAYLAAIGEALGIPFSRADWLRTRRLATLEDAAATALARAVGARTRVALLTNNGLLMKQHFDDIVPWLRPIFGPAMHVAAEFRTKKPDPDIFRRLVALHGVAPEDAVMIDDKPGHVAGARAAGLGGHHFRATDELAAYLGSLDLI